MSALGTMVLRGKSGREYRFRVWSIDTHFGSVGAVYVLTKRTFDNTTFQRLASHECVGIGKTADLARVHAFVGDTAADCVCVLTVKEDERRAVIEQDLVEASLGGWRSLRKISALTP